MAKPVYPDLPNKLILMSAKAYFSPSYSTSYLESLLEPSNGVISSLTDEILIAFIPDFLAIYPSSQILAKHISKSSTHPQSWPIHLGAQDCFWSADYGAYTGEVVPAGLAELGVTIVELGHAERRRLLSETDETTARKAAAAASKGMVSLVCIGEVGAPDLAGPLSAAVGNAMKQLNPQVLSLLEAVPLDAPVIFAYEPVWAIGAEKPAGVDYVGPVVQAIRHVIDGFAKQKGRTGQTKVIYGGSAGPGLWSGRTNGGNGLGQWMDGLFLGRFGHKVEGVKGVVDEVVEGLKQ